MQSKQQLRSVGAPIVSWYKRTYSSRLLAKIRHKPQPTVSMLKTVSKEVGVIHASSLLPRISHTKWSRFAFHDCVNACHGRTTPVRESASSAIQVEFIITSSLYLSLNLHHQRLTLAQRTRPFPLL